MMKTNAREEPLALAGGEIVDYTNFIGIGGDQRIDCMRANKAGSASH